MNAHCVNSDGTAVCICDDGYFEETFGDASFAGCEGKESYFQTCFFNDLRSKLT